MRSGPRFPDMTKAYDEGLKELMCASAKKNGIDLKHRHVCHVPGAAVRNAGGDPLCQDHRRGRGGHVYGAGGHAARHGGMRICAVSCITNMAAGMLDQPLTHQEVMETGERVKDVFKKLIDGFFTVVIRGKRINTLYGA